MTSASCAAIPNLSRADLEEIAYIRSWSKEFVGPGSPEPGHYGLSELPKPGTNIRAYVFSNQDGGFDALEPNGLQAIR